MCVGILETPSLFPPKTKPLARAAAGWECGLCAGQPGRAPAPQYGPAAGSPGGLGCARSRRSPSAARGPSTPASRSRPAQTALCGFRGAASNPRLRPRTPEISAPGDPLTAPLVAAPRRRDPTPERASPLPGGARSRLLRAGQPGRSPALGPGLAPVGTYLCRGITSHAMLAMEPLPGRPPRLWPCPQRRQRLAGERPAPGRGEGPPGPGWRLPTARPSTDSLGPAPQLRHLPPARPCSSHRARQAQGYQKRLLMASCFWACKRCHKPRANRSFQQKDPTRSSVSLSVTITHRPCS